jgi:hypothetical protein
MSHCRGSRKSAPNKKRLIVVAGCQGLRIDEGHRETTNNAINRRKKKQENAFSSLEEEMGQADQTDKQDRGETSGN